jgi:dipicolinate synthase subunit B
VLLCTATNDGLGATAQNIGKLINTKNIYFVPMSQDDFVNKPNSLVAHFDLIPQCVGQVLDGVQPQPVFG